MSESKLLKLTDRGLFCEEGNFYIDPWRPVEKAVITHAHSDHARAGSKFYLAEKHNEALLKLRLGEDIILQTVNYFEKLKIGDVTVSFHPAGHILGSAQIRIELNGEVWVVSGDYKIEADLTCEPFEPVKCNTFITESTFGLPIYKWCPQNEVYEDINNWWLKNNSNGITSVIFGYSLGKAQRIIAHLDDTIGPIFSHGAVENINFCYREEGINLPATTYVNQVEDKKIFKGGIVVAPPSADYAVWTKKFGTISTAFASGWMQIRGNRRRRSVDRGFVLSDHADWDDILNTVKETGAENILVTHGYSSVLVKWLNEIGCNADVLQTKYEGEIE